MTRPSKETRKKQKLKYLKEVASSEQQSIVLREQLSVEDIQSAINSGSHLEQLIVQVVNNLTTKDFSNETDILLNLPKYVQYLYVTWLLEADVMHEGLEHFFSNRSPRLWHIALDGYIFYRLLDSKFAIERALVKAHTGLTDFTAENKILDSDWHQAKDVKDEHIRNNPHLYVII